MKFTQDYQVFSTDTGRNGLVRPAVVLRYLQETAVRQMLTEKPSYRELFDQGYAFILSRIRVQFCLPLYEYEHFTVETWACNEHGASFGRCYRLIRDGQTVAQATAVWALVNVADGSLMRAESVPFHYGSDEPLDLSARMAFPKIALQEVGERVVQYEDVDCNGHLNNARYPDWLCNYMPDIDTVRVTDMTIHYVNEAPLGETVTVHRGEIEDGTVFETRLSDGRVNVRAVIMKEKIE